MSAALKLYIILQNIQTLVRKIIKTPLKLHSEAPVQRWGAVYGNLPFAPQSRAGLSQKNSAVAVASLHSAHNENSKKPKVWCCTTNSLHHKLHIRKHTKFHYCFFLQ